MYQQVNHGINISVLHFILGVATVTIGIQLSFLPGLRHPNYKEKKILFGALRVKNSSNGKILK
jgi:hypothetical protein